MKGLRDITAVIQRDQATAEDNFDFIPLVPKSRVEDAAEGCVNVHYTSGTRHKTNDNFLLRQKDVYGLELDKRDK